MNWDWIIWGIGLVVVSGLVVLAIIEFVAAVIDDGRTSWRIKRAVYGVLYLGVAWFTLGGNLGAVVCAIAVGIICFMRIVR